MDLFTVAKIPMYCESIAHRMEKRKDHDVKVVDLALKIQPFTPQLAAALNQDEYGFVKRTLFKMSNGDPTVDLRSVEFRPPSDRQDLLCFAAPDINNKSISLTHAKITKIRARSSKDANGWVLYVNVSFGPLSKEELMWVNDFYTAQSFITFRESEPSLEFTDDDSDADAEPDGGGRPAPMFDDDAADSMPVEGRTAREVGARTIPKRRATKPRAKVDHDAERVKQRAAGTKKAKKGKR